MNQCVPIEGLQAIPVNLNMNTGCLAAYMKEQTSIKLDGQIFSGTATDCLYVPRAHFLPLAMLPERFCWKTAQTISHVQPHCYVRF